MPNFPNWYSISDSMSSSEEISLHDAVFEDDPDPFNCDTARPAPKTRHLTGFPDHKLFSLPAFQPTQFPPGNLCAPAPDRTWGNGDGHHHSADDSDDDDDREEDDDGDGEENNNNISINSSNNNNSTGETLRGPASGNGDKIGDVIVKHHSSFGVGVGVGESREVAVQNSCNLGQAGRESIYQNAVTIAEPDGDIYYSHYLQGVEGSSGGGEKDAIAENGGGAGFSGRKDGSFSCESGESLRAILSDPVTGALMYDAMILPCGHSFGAGGIQHVMRMKACYTCSQSVSEDQVAANLSLRAAVQAFCQEEELRFYCSSKRRKERFDQDKSSFGDSNLMDNPKGRGVQFPFSVTDRVFIKGNKRTPQRFVGREAVVTTQCLNGWYAVKTLDNAESVKLQYRSLAKVPDDPSSKPMSSKMARNWV